MADTHHSITMEKDQVILLKALSKNLQKYSNAESEKISRIIQVVLFELMTERKSTLADSRYLPHDKREKLINDAISLFLERTKVNETHHDIIRNESLDIYRKWVAGVRVAPAGIEAELNELVDALLDKGVLGPGSLAGYNKRKKKW